MKFTINFCLVASERFADHVQQRALTSVSDVNSLKIPYIVTCIIADLVDAGFKVLRHEVSQSNTEPTLVAELAYNHNVSRAFMNSKLTLVANRFAQDCVAIKYSNGVGDLVGYYAKEWGEFNNDYFIELSPEVITHITPDNFHKVQFPCFVRSINHPEAAVLLLDADNSVLVGAALRHSGTGVWGLNARMTRDTDMTAWEILPEFQGVTLWDGTVQEDKQHG